jgi:uncharacterized SAM-binding protein YcdF (DUF218 family)
VTGLVWYVFSVGGIVCSFLISAIWARARPHSHTPRRVLIALALAYALASVFGISYSLEQLLAAGFRPLVRTDVPAGRNAIVVLGSASYTARSWSEDTFSVLDRAAAARVVEAIRVFRLIDPAWVISSGGVVDPRDPSEPTGLTMRDALVQMGVPPSRILVETESRNTHDEAVMVRSMLRPLQVDHVILVTSELHMRRSVGTFRGAGVEVIPAIARNSFFVDHWIGWVVPTNNGFAETSLLAHEIFGTAYYLLRGWYRFS